MIEQIQAPSIEDLLEQLQTSSDAQVRAWAVGSLEEQKASNQNVIDALRNAATSDDNKNVRGAATSALVKLGIVLTKEEMEEGLTNREVARIKAKKEQLERDAPVTNWQAVRIGAQVGFGTTFAIFSIILLSDLAFYFGMIISYSIIGGVLGIVGALIGKYLSNSLQGTRIGAWIGIWVGGFTLFALLLAPHG